MSASHQSQRAPLGPAIFDVAPIVAYHFGMDMVPVISSARFFNEDAFFRSCLPREVVVKLAVAAIRAHLPVQRVLSWLRLAPASCWNSIIVDDFPLLFWAIDSGSSKDCVEITEAILAACPEATTLRASVSERGFTSFVGACRAASNPGIDVRLSRRRCAELIAHAHKGDPTALGIHIPALAAQGAAQEEERPGGGRGGGPGVGNGRPAPAPVLPGVSHLQAACDALMLDLVSTWITQPHVTDALICAESRDGHNPFTCCTWWMRDHQKVLTQEERATAAAVAKTIASHPACGPELVVGVSRRNQFNWAAQVGLLDVVQQWLGDPRMNAQVMCHLDGKGWSAFGNCCYWAITTELSRSAEEKQRIMDCARAIAFHPLCNAFSIAGDNETNLWWAVACGLPDVVAHFLSENKDVLALGGGRVLRGSSGDTLFGKACFVAAGWDEDVSVQQRRHAAACARLLAPYANPDCGQSMPAFWYAAGAGLHDVVKTWLEDPRVTVQTLHTASVQRGTAFALACSHAAGIEELGVLQAQDREDAAEVASLIARSPKFNASISVRIGAYGQKYGTTMTDACRAGLQDVVSDWVAGRLARPPDWTPDMDGKGLHNSAAKGKGKEDGHNAFSAACEQLRSLKSELTTEERSRIAACARLVLPVLEAHHAASQAGSRVLTPYADVVAGGGRTNLYWAARAGMVDVVERWSMELDAYLADPLSVLLSSDASYVRARVGMGYDAFVMHKRDNKPLPSPFGIACYWAKDERRKLTVEERQQQGAAALALVRCGGGNLTMSSDCHPPLYMAAWAGLTEVVRHWASSEQGSISREMLQYRDERGHTPFSIACWSARDLVLPSSVGERQSAAATAVELASLGIDIDPAAQAGLDSSNLWWTCYAGLSSVVEAWISRRAITADLLQCVGWDGRTPMQVAQRWAQDEQGALTPQERQDAERCLHLIAGADLSAAAGEGAGAGAGMAL